MCLGSVSASSLAGGRGPGSDSHGFRSISLSPTVGLQDELSGHHDMSQGHPKIKLIVLYLHK